MKDFFKTLAWGLPAAVFVAVLLAVVAVFPVLQTILVWGFIVAVVGFTVYAAGVITQLLYNEHFRSN